MYDTYGTIDFNGENIQDITTRYIMEARTNEYGISMLIEYMIKDWESPENIAYDLYGSCDYAWIILLCNDIVNPFTDWLMTNEEMEEMIELKYANHKRDIHHYELDGHIYWTNILGATPVSNAEYEYDKNEKKRIIKAVPPDVINQIEEALRKA